MTAEFPIGAMPVATSVVSPGHPDDGLLDIRDTVLSQYANSPIILRLVDTFFEWFGPSERFRAFYDDIWNIMTARGFGLDVWGRILGVGRVIPVPSGEYFGFDQQPEALSWDWGIFYRGVGGTDNAILTDEAFRLLLLAKAALNITDSSIPSINKILLDLFGDGYVRDNLDMTVTYVFSAPLDPVQTSIVFASGVLPRPCGVLANVETA